MPLKRGKAHVMKVKFSWDTVCATPLGESSNFWGQFAFRLRLSNYYFLAGMKGEADTNNNGQITNGEMEAYLEEMVPAKVNELSQFEREQNPTFNGKTNKILVNLK